MTTPYVEQRAQVLKTLGFFWLKVFLDSDFVTGFSGSVSAAFADMQAAAERLPQYMSRYLIPLKELEDNRYFLFNENTLDRQTNHYGDSGLFYDGTSAYGQTTEVLDQWVYPFDSDYVPAYLAVSIQGASTILKNGQDYDVETDKIVFHTNPLDLAGIEKRFSNGYWSFLLWGFAVEHDIHAVRDFFGVFAKVTGNSTQLYKTAVNAAWDIRIEGATVRNVQKILCAITDTDYTSAGGTVTAVFEEGDRICVLTDTDLYSAPSTSSALVSEGDTIETADILFDSYCVSAGEQVIPFDDFTGISLGKGMLGAEYNNNLLFVNDNEQVSLVHDPTWTQVEKI